MTNIINGPNIILKFEPNELTQQDYDYTLPLGYSINIICVTYNVNVQAINRAYIHQGNRLVFPVVNSKSPSTITINIPDITKKAEIRFTIEKFGQIPDKTYFKNAFTPILVTGDDGNKYNVIPSDQFK